MSRKPLSVYAALGVGLILVIEPTLPQYHLSPFWFSLGGSFPHCRRARSVSETLNPLNRLKDV